MVGLLLTIGGTTSVKCGVILETPAATHTTTISSLSAMIMSTYGSTVKKNSAGRYCSPRAAKKMVLSRSPIKTSSTIGAINSVGFTKPDALSGKAADSESLGTPGTTSGTITLTIRAK
jgi:hypothetical protein